MPKYKVSFEYETEVEADNEEDAIFNCSTVICEYMGDNAIVEEIEEASDEIS
jgi:NADH:ubiquinone oxidoreductase subunit E